jgi:hypothetical protein
VPVSLATSPSIAAIATALAAAAPHLLHAGKDRQNPHLRNRYATLEAVVDAVREPLAAQGVAFIQAPSVAEGRVRVTTRLIHSSGEWLECSLELPVPEPKGITMAQAIGSAVTYGRRYTLAALCGVGAEEDDDGSGTGQARSLRRVRVPVASEAAPQAAPQAPPEPKHHPSWEGDRAAFCAELSRRGLTYAKVASDLEALGKPRPSAMTGEQRAKTLAWLANRGGGAK